MGLHRLVVQDFGQKVVQCCQCSELCEAPLGPSQEVVGVGCAPVAETSEILQPSAARNLGVKSL